MTLFCPSGPSTVSALHMAAATLDVYPLPVICATCRTSEHWLQVCMHKGNRQAGRPAQPNAKSASHSD